MVAQKGRDMLIKIGDGASPPVYTTIGGIRSSTLTINNEQVDITTKDDAPFRALLGDTGIRSISVSGSGVFLDGAPINDCEDRAMDGALDDYQVIFENGDAFEFSAQVSSFEHAGEHNGEQTYTIALESSGTVTLERA